MRWSTAVLVLPFLAAACGGAAAHRPGTDQLARLQENSDEPVYYAGPSFAGLLLTAAVPQGRKFALLVYGDCTPRSDSGRAPPIEIEHFPFRPTQWRRAVGCHQLAPLRGVPTLRHDGLVLVTGHQIVKIYARTPIEERRLALVLRRIDGRPTARQLPRPPTAIRALVDRVCRSSR